MKQAEVARSRMSMNPLQVHRRVDRRLGHRHFESFRDARPFFDPIVFFSLSPSVPEGKREYKHSTLFSLVMIQSQTCADLFLEVRGQHYIAFPSDCFNNLSLYPELTPLLPARP